MQNFMKINRIFYANKLNIYTLSGFGVGPKSDTMMELTQDQISLHVCLSMRGIPHLELIFFKFFLTWVEVSANWNC